MNYRNLGRTGWKVSEISFGAWAIGGAWGGVDDKESLAALHAALDGGVNFFDTADVYGDGRSERLLAKLRKERPEKFYIATKAGRRLPKQSPEGYSHANLTSWIERSLRNLDTDAIDLLQLHCPHPDVYYRPEVFGILDDLVTSGKLRHYGVSVEKVEEALKAIEYPKVQSVQIIFNISGSVRPSCFSRRRNGGKRGYSPGCRWHRGCCRARFRGPASLPRMTTGISTATARPSTGAKRLPAWILKRPCGRWMT